MKFTPAKEWQSSWNQGEVKTTYAKLVKVFGLEHSSGDECKVRAEWDLTFENGTHATIYDWKEYIPKEQVTNWHIGGTSQAAVDCVTDAIASYVAQPVEIDYSI